MSGSQVRAERFEGYSRKPARLGVSGYRGISGGGRGDGAAAVAAAPAPPFSSLSCAARSPSTSVPPLLSANRSFKRSGNGQGNQPRYHPVSTSSSGSAAVQNGSHAQANPQSSTGPSDSSTPACTGPADMPVMRTSFQAVPRAPPSQSDTGAPPDASVPSTPFKEDSSGAFILQFGTISPGIVNRMQIPARTSSAPPNLDEQKRNQAQHGPSTKLPTSVPFSSKQQQQLVGKESCHSTQANTGPSHPPPQNKREALLPSLFTPSLAQPKSSAAAVSGMPMPIPFEYQPSQAPLQFGGPSLQVRSQCALSNALPMAMILPVGNTPQVQQMFVPGIQAHSLQQPTLVHQGQGLGFPPPSISQQLPPQLANMGIRIAPQYPHQQPVKFGGPRKNAVKITHPETHEELRLDKRTDPTPDVSSGPRPLPNSTPQSQSIPAFTPSHQINYYSPLQQSSYNPSQIYFPPGTTVPLASGLMPTGSQPPRYSYASNQAPQPISFMNPSMLNPIPGGKPGQPTPLHGISEAASLGSLPSSALSTPIQVTVKPPVGKHGEKVGTSPVTIGIHNSKEPESPRLLRPIVDVATSHQGRDWDVGQESSVQVHKPLSEAGTSLSAVVTERRSTASTLLISTQQKQSETSSSASVTYVTDSESLSEGSDDRKKELFQRSDSFDDHQKGASTRDVTDARKQPQLDVLDPSLVADVRTEQASKRSGSAQVSNHFPSPSIESGILSESQASGEPEDESKPSSTSGAEEKSEKVPLCSSDACIERVGHPEMTPLGPEVGGAMLCNLDASCSHDGMLLKQPREGMPARETETNVSAAPLQVFSEVKVHPVLAMEELTDAVNPIVMRKKAEEPENAEKVEALDNKAEKQQLDASEEDAVYMLEGDNDKEKSVKSVITSTESAGVDLLSVRADPSPNAANEPSHPFANTNKCEMGNKQSSFLTQPRPIPLDVPAERVSGMAERTQNLENKVAELSGDGPIYAVPSVHKDKPPFETIKAKNSAGRKKKRKEILLKADSAGTSDLYNAYKGQGEKHENAGTIKNNDNSKMADEKNIPLDEHERDVSVSEEDGRGKYEFDDWEDAADVSTPKLKSEGGQQVKGTKMQPDEEENEATNRKKYSKDFLLTFAQQCVDLPIGFEIGSDIADALMSGPVGKSYIIGHEPHSSPGRIVDRTSGTSRVDRRVGSNMDDERWARPHCPINAGRDPRFDASYGPALVNLRSVQGVNHGVLRNPRGLLANQILSGPMQSVSSQGSMQRSSSDTERWQRATGIERGLIPSPKSSLLVMHKAERKYQVGKVSDEEEAKQRQLKAILNKLTPQNFEKLFEQVKEVDIDNTVTLTGVISQIFDKALMEPTFCEMYANFCFHLAGALPDFSENDEKITFKRLLLNKCQEEFERGEKEQAEADKMEEDGEIKQSKGEREQKRFRARRRMLGNIRLIGELYKKKMLTERIMHECIKKLLGQYQNPDEEHLEALCKLMSTIGQMIDHPKAKEHMDAYFDMMQQLSTNQNLSSRVRFMLKDAIDLRKNKWQQRRMVEGPKKIEEVHRDAAQEKQSQASRLARTPVNSSLSRRGSPVDYGARGSSLLVSPGSQLSATRGLSSQIRGYGTQDARLEEKHQFESRTLAAVPLPQRPVNGDSITLGPQSSRIRVISNRGHPAISNVASAESPQSSGEHCTRASGLNGHSDAAQQASYNSAEDNSMRYMTNNSVGVAFDRPSSQESKRPVSRNSRIATQAPDRPTSQPAEKVHGLSSDSQYPFSDTKALSEEILQAKSLTTIREYYSAKDEEEVALCMKELNAPSFYPSAVSLWITDSFERRERERDLLAKLLVSLCKTTEHLLTQMQLIQAFESVLAALEDAVNDAPKATEFLGRIFAKVIAENVVPLREIGRLLREGGEEPGRLLKIGLASEVLGSTLESVRIEKGDSALNEIRASSNLPMEEFPPSKKLDAFLQAV